MQVSESARARWKQLPPLAMGEIVHSLAMFTIAEAQRGQRPFELAAVIEPDIDVYIIVTEVKNVSYYAVVGESPRRQPTTVKIDAGRIDSRNAAWAVAQYFNLNSPVVVPISGGTDVP